MSQPPTQMTLEALRSVPLFGSLDDDAATDLRNLISGKTVPQNTRLFKQGDKGDAMYLIESGRVRISIRDAEKQEVTLAELAQGDFFGEMSIIDGRQRSADAQVIEDARLAVARTEARRPPLSFGTRTTSGRTTRAAEVPDHAYLRVRPRARRAGGRGARRSWTARHGR